MLEAKKLIFITVGRGCRRMGKIKILVTQSSRAGAWAEPHNSFHNYELGTIPPTFVTLVLVLARKDLH